MPSSAVTVKDEHMYRACDYGQQSVVPHTQNSM